MDPKDFLNTASSLAGSSRESDLRTSVSRSYYAVILFFRNFFANKLGFWPEKIASEVHKFVPECFNESGLEEAKKIGEKIKRCKTDRTTADYKLSKSISPNRAGDSLELAKELITKPLSANVEAAILEQARKRAEVRQWI